MQLSVSLSDLCADTRTASSPCSRFFKKCPGKGGNTPLDQLAANRTRFPELWGHVLFACVEEQVTALSILWRDKLPLDTEVILAWQSVANFGFVHKVLDLNDPNAKTMFLFAYNGVKEALKLKDTSNDKHAA